MAFANIFIVSSLGGFFLFPIFLLEHGGSKVDIGIIMGVFVLSSVIFRPWISVMIDRIGRKMSYTIGCIITTLLPIVYLLFRGELADFYMPLLLARALHGIGAAICFTGVFTYVADIIPKTRLNEGIGMFGLAGLLGMAIGPIIAEVVIKNFGFSIFFLTTAGLSLFGLLFQLPLPESFGGSEKVKSQHFFSLLRRKKFFTVSVLAFLFGIGLAAFANFISPMAEYRQLSFISSYYISYASGAAITRLFGGRLADRVGERRIMPYGLVLAGLGHWVLIYHGGTEILIIGGILSGIGHGFLFPLLSALAIRNEPIHIRGKITGIVTGGIDAGLFSGAIILGYIGEWVGFRALFFTAGFALMSGLMIYKRAAVDSK
jgi:MFS family permease